MAGLSAAHATTGCHTHKMEQCHLLFASEGIVRAYIEQGAFLLTPGWLARWRDYLADEGFLQETARDFFKETASKLVLLDTGVDTNSHDNLRLFADFVGLPFEVLPVGIDFFRLFLSKLVLEWQLGNEMDKTTAAAAAASGRVADYAAALDFVGSLSQTATETEAIHKMLDLLTALMSPGKLAYLSLKGDSPVSLQSIPAAEDDETLKARLGSFKDDWAWIQSGTGFRLRISHQGETLGILEADSLLFPESRDQYLNLSLILRKVCGLAISNARTYQELVRTEGKYRTLYESVKDGIAMVDMNGNVLECNQAYLDMLGYTREEISQLSNQQLTPEDWHARDREVAASQIMQRGYSDEYEKEYIRKDGTVFPVSLRVWLITDPDGSPIGMWGIVRDITERKRAEQAIRISEGELSAILASAPVMMLVVDEERRVLKVNEAAARFSGFRIEEMLGLHSGEALRCLHSMDDPRGCGFGPSCQNCKTRLCVLDTFETGTSHLQVEWHTPHLRNGKTEEVTFLLSTVLLPTPKKQVLLCIDDISERKRAENEIRRLNEVLTQRATELEIANKELETFSYSVSHDLRAPLRSLDGFSQVLLEDYSDKLDRDAKDHLNRIRESSQLMGQLIDDMLMLSRVTRAEVHLQKINLSEMARRVAEGLKRTRSDRIADFAITPRLQAFSDANLLRIVLENLLENAWKFTGNRTQAQIEFGRTKIDGAPTFYVRDNGVGFNMQYAHKLFAPFQRLHSTTDFPGTGIGLATVQRIIHRLGGRVWAEGKPDEGATFYFTLNSII
ncbi:MAG: PAS domain S-box protein [Chloroflexi bacterium]|nr:PAS domain S-box protein [Chloroflexota bacterium]